MLSGSKRSRTGRSPSSCPPSSPKESGENVHHRAKNEEAAAAVEKEQEPEMFKEQSAEEEEEEEKEEEEEEEEENKPRLPSASETSSEEELETITIINVGDRPVTALQRSILAQWGIPVTTGEEAAEPPPPLEPLMAENPWSIRKIYKRKKKGQDCEFLRPEHPEKLLFGKSRSEDDDAITILKFILYYHSDTGVYPSPDSIAFHGFIKNSIGSNVSAILLRDKILRLRKKYMKIVKRKGVNPDFLRSHDREVFEMSKRIWGHKVNPADDQSKLINEEQRTNLKAGEEQDLSNEEQRTNSEAGQVLPETTSGGSGLDEEVQD